MRADEVRNAIVAAVEATPVDAKASSVDVFKYLQPGMREVVMARDRVFTVDIIAAPLRAKRIFVNDLYECAWNLDVYYSDAPGIQDRIILDVERLSQKLEALARDNAAIQLIMIGPADVTLTDGQIIATISINTTYRLTSGV